MLNKKNNVSKDVILKSREIDNSPGTNGGRGYMENFIIIFSMTPSHNTWNETEWKIRINCVTQIILPEIFKKVFFYCYLENHILIEPHFYLWVEHCIGYKLWRYFVWRVSDPPPGISCELPHKIQGSRWIHFWQSEMFLVLKKYIIIIN